MDTRQHKPALSSAMRSLHLIAMGVAGVGLLVTVALMIALGARRPAPPAPTVPDQGLEGMSFPEFALVDQNGTPQTQALLDGHYTIVDFMFTNCPMICPAMTGRMAELQATLADTGVRFASLSLDPANDTPDVLREYASHFGADHSTWTFLTGDRERVWSIVTDALHFELREMSENQITLANGSKMPNILHPTRFILVGPRRQILGLYSYGEPEQLAMLARRARELANGS